jgi:hypothetical protein
MLDFEVVPLFKNSVIILAETVILCVESIKILLLAFEILLQHVDSHDHELVFTLELQHGFFYDSDHYFKQRTVRGSVRVNSGCYRPARAPSDQVMITDTVTGVWPSDGPTASR